MSLDLSSKLEIVEAYLTETLTAQEALQEAGISRATLYRLADKVRQGKPLYASRVKYCQTPFI